MKKGTVHSMDFRTEHQRKIDAFIPQAMREARKKVRETGKPYDYRDLPGGKYKFCLTSMHFHKAMTRLTVEAGLRSQ